MVTRRKFITLFGAASAVAASGLPALPTPSILGNGVHDDTDGFVALFERRPVLLSKAVAREDGVTIRMNGRFVISRPMKIRASRLFMEDCAFIIRPKQGEDYVAVECRDVEFWSDGPGEYYPLAIQGDKLFERSRA